MMNKIFQSIETELNSLIALGDKMDSFHSLYMLVKMSHHVWTAENVDPASYLSTTLGNVLVTVKRNFDKCIVSLLTLPAALGSELFFQSLSGCVYVFSTHQYIPYLPFYGFRSLMDLDCKALVLIVFKCTDKV